MRSWRERAHEKGHGSITSRAVMRIWGYAAKRPALYHLLARFGVAIAGSLGRSRGRFVRLPMARGWTAYRDFPAPQGRTFQQLWIETERGVPR
jgi:L-lactate dehydrogenase complex protein LldF